MDAGRIDFVCISLKHLLLEAFAIPTEEAATIALRTQQIVANEAGVTGTVDPLGEVSRRVFHHAAMTMECEDHRRGLHLRFRRNMNQRKSVDAEYFDLLNRCQLDDNSIFDARVVEEESGLAISGPLSADFFQDHVVYYLE